MDIGHAFHEISNITCLQLFKFSRRLFDQNDIVKNFTNAIKVREFVGEQDLFDDMVQARNSFKEVLNSAKEQLSPGDFQEFKLYRERRLIPIPLDNLRIEPAKEQTPSVSLNTSSSTGKSKSKSDRDSEHSNKSKEKEDKMEESIKDPAQSKELAQQQILISQQTNPPPPNVQQQPVTIELDKEWETFNQLINVEGQNVQTPVQTTKVLNAGTSSTAAVTEHIPITPSS